MKESAQVQQEEDIWIKHREAARLLGVNEKLLRLRTGAGGWLHYPHLVRRQRARRATIWLRLADVRAQVAREARPVEPPRVVARTARQELTQMLARYGAAGDARRLLGG